jgi:LEA14-like dessication related protein
MKYAIWCPLLFLLLSCATREPAAAEPLPPEPPPREYPAARLVFDRIEAAAPDRVSILFSLEADNPGTEAVRVQAGGWNAVVNGVDRTREGSLVLDGGVLAAGASRVYPLRLETDPLPDAVDQENGDAELSVDILFAFDLGGEIRTPVKAVAVFPLVRKVRMRIASIAVMKADLINTRFKVVLRIDNPNRFPVELSAFRYELYNAGRLWADGVKTDILGIPPENSAETELFLTMNFIDMSRELLNEVTAMRGIHYRFTGEVWVSAGTGGLAPFRMAYDLSGYSDVIE